ncbi:MAG: SUMF1/EgtB/PvdO family nonheme iron enzyme [Thermodesulfobacteriota bacterium]
MKNHAGWSNTVTLEGIDQAIEALGYRNRRSPKYRLVDAVRQAWVKSQDTDAKFFVSADDLIRILWNIPEDSRAAISRRRNLSSLRSSVNADLMALYRSGENSGGVIIGPDYMFTICDEAKDQALATLQNLARGGGPDLKKIEEVLRGVQEVIGGREKAGIGASESESVSLEAIREAIRVLAEDLGVSQVGKDVLEEEDLEEAYEEDLEEAYEDVEVIDDTGEEAVIVEDDVLEDEPDSEAPVVEDELEEAYEDVEVIDDTGEELSEPESVPDEWGGSKDRDGGPPDPEKARLLAETFNDSLAATDRFYNQHILVPQGIYHVHASSSNGDGPCEVQVELDDFFIGKFPVTNALFEVFVEKTGYRTRAEQTGYGMVYHGRYRRCVDEQRGKETLIVRSGIVCTRVEGACWYRPSGPDSSLRNRRNHPVVQVSLEDALAFAAWTGKRLPSEEEWEGAMRTADGNLLPWGDVWERDACNVEEGWIGDTSPVDRFLPYANPLGLADGVGNVLEWTMSVGGERDPSLRVAKGSSWIAANSITLASRIALPRETSSNILGFRCVAY